MLSNVNSQAEDGSGDGQDAGMPINYFDLIYERLLKEVETLMMSVKQVMSLPVPKMGHGRKLSEKGN
jgi:hypothetical protein